MPRHLLTVWNPAYADDALDAHPRVLLRWAERDAELRADTQRLARDLPDNLGSSRSTD